MAWDAPWDAVGISWDETSALPTDPSPATTTSHTAGEEAVGPAHTSLTIKVIILISTSPSHPVTGHRKYELHSCQFRLVFFSFRCCWTRVPFGDSHSLTFSSCTEGRIEHHIKGCCSTLYPPKISHNCTHRDEFRVMPPTKRSN